MTCINHGHTGKTTQEVVLGKSIMGKRMKDDKERAVRNAPFKCDYLF